MGLGALLKQTAAAAAAPYVRFDAQSRVLAVSFRVLRPAAERALARVRQLRSATVDLQPEGLVLRATTTGGVIVGTTLVPRKLELRGESLVVHASLPRGLSVRHENAALGLALGLADGLLGASERLVNTHVKGAQLRDGELTYTHSVADLGLPRILRQLGWQPESHCTVPLRLHEGWLELDLRQAAPADFQLDIGALLGLLRPAP